VSETEISPGTSANCAPTPLEDVEEALKGVFDPELGANVVDLGLLYSLEYGQGSVVVITMTLTSAACPLAGVIDEQVGRALNGVVRKWRLNWVWMPPWGPDRITEEGREQMRTFGLTSRIPVQAPGV
jgi:metal-sulfur cluster biosynthetic enzyme